MEPSLLHPLNTCLPANPRRGETLSVGNVGKFGTGRVWWLPHTHALAGHNLFTSQQRSTGRCSRGASALSREASPRRTVRLPSRRAPGACLPPAFPSSPARLPVWLGLFLVWRWGRAGLRHCLRPAACSSDPYCHQRSTRQKPPRGAGQGAMPTGDTSQEWI